jgi:transposase-like protein
MAGKHRQHSPEFKAKVVLELLQGKKTASKICRTHKLNVNVLNRWRNEFVQKASSIFEQVELRSEEEQKIAELEQLVGQLTMRLEIAKNLDFLGSNEKREVVMQLESAYPIATICEVLDYARSQVY